MTINLQSFFPAMMILLVVFSLFGCIFYLRFEDKLTSLAFLHLVALLLLVFYGEKLNRAENDIYFQILLGIVLFETVIAGFVIRKVFR